MKKGIVLCFSLAVGGVLLFAALAPVKSTAATFLGVDCLTCHTGSLADTHHVYASSQGIQCTACHVMQWTGKSYVVLTDQNCTNCHSGANHESAHDKGYFSVDPQISIQCLTCHQQMITEHLRRSLTCATCHNSSDPDVQAAILKGQGPTGLPIYCRDCHNDGTGSYGVHVAAHDKVCTGCHVLTPDAKGALLGIHTRVPPRSASICADCHRNGTTELAKNTIFTVPVNAGPGEPPDYDYPVLQFFNGSCAKCHGSKTNMGNDGAKGCLPCHFLTPSDSYPSEPNGFIGSQVWGHRFQKRNNQDQTVSKPRK